MSLIIELRFIKMRREMAPTELMRGGINETQIPPELVGQLTQKGLKILEGPHDWGAKLVINHQRPPFSDRAFRHALAYAIDRQEIVDTCLRGFALPGNPGFFPTDHFNQRHHMYRVKEMHTGKSLRSFKR